MKNKGYGSAYLAKQIGQKRAREIFFLGLDYSAEEAFQSRAHVKNLLATLRVVRITALAIRVQNFSVTDEKSLSGLDGSNLPPKRARKQLKRY